MGKSNDWPFSPEVNKDLNTIGYTGNLNGKSTDLYEHVRNLSTPKVGCNLTYLGGNNMEFTDEYLLTITENSLSDKELNSGEEAIVALSSALGISEKQVIEIIHDGMILNTKGKMTPSYKEFIEEMTATFDAY